jgi:CHAT domain-containing protein
LAQAAPGGRAVLVPVGRWRAIPLHVACEIGAEATDDAGPLPVLSYAATGVPTTPMPLLTTLTTRPSMIMTDLAAGSMPDRAVADIVDMECRLLETRLGPQATILNGPDATGQSLAGFLRSQPDCGLVHLSIHGSERAEDRPAWVDEQATETATNGAIGHAMAIPELCTVLACTSAGADQEYLDEVVRMQQSTMLGGIPEVVLNQWPAGDLAAALFSSYFYQRLLGDGMPCWQAVHEARAWLRSLTDDDVIAYIDQQGVEDRPSLVSGSQKTFGDLWGWGGFAHVQAW